MADYQLIVYVIDEVTNGAPNNPPGEHGTPVTASVFVYPSSQNKSTDSNGIATFTLPEGSYSVQVTAPGYNPTNQPAVVSADSNVYVPLGAMPVAQIPISINIVPALSGATWIVSGPSSISGTFVNGQAISSNGIMSLDPGDYDITVTAAGYTSNPNPVSVTVSPSSSTFTIPIIQSTDQGQVPVANTTTVNSDAIQQALLQNPIADYQTGQSEWIPPTDSYNKYFTATQARIYVGNLFIDEVNGLQFALQDNTIPIFGYASKYADAYGSGRSLIQGQLVINFISEMYLLTVLEEFKTKTQPTPPQPSQAVQTAVDLTNKIKILRAAGANDTLVSTLVDARLRALAGTGLPGISAVKAANTVVKSSGPVYNNPVYQSTVFDLEVKLGEGPTQRTRRLEKIKLTSNEVIYDQSGQPILDTYGFIARRLL